PVRAARLEGRRQGQLGTAAQGACAVRPKRLHARQRPAAVPLKRTTMQHLTSPRWRSLLIAAVLGLGASWALAQAPKAEPPVDDPAPAQQSAPAAAPAQQAGGIQSQNIFQVRPDADTDPNYANQSNAERRKVQPGNNAPVWRDVSKG